MPKRFEEAYEGKPILYWFHHDRVLARDASAFLETFDVSRIQAAGKLRELRGVVHLVFRGWDDDPRALHEIPEVRAFVAELDRQFPYLAYVTTTQTEVLRIMALCLVPNSVTARLGDKQTDQFAASYNIQAYHEVLTRWFRSCDEIAARGRCFTWREHAQKTNELASYFGVKWCLEVTRGLAPSRLATMVIMHLSRVLACVLLPNVGIAAACAARDKSVADFRAPVPAPVPVTPPAMATARAPNTPVAQLPPKIVFAASRVSISRDGANYLFRLAEAPMPEIIAAVAALFRVKAIYAGSGSRVVSGDFSAQSIEQVLAWLSDGSSLRYTAEGGRWVIREMSDAVPPVPMMSLASVLTFAAPASPEIAGESMTTSAARAGR